MSSTLLKYLKNQNINQNINLFNQNTNQKHHEKSINQPTYYLSSLLKPLL